MKKACLNPYLPLNEYVPDGEPHVFGNRIYIYGSHDKQDGEVYCMLDYVSYSAPLDDLSDWRYEGVIYRRDQDPHCGEGVYLWAPDVCQGPDGRYYLYYTLSNELEIAVAVCDEPAGQYTYLGRVSYPDGRVLRDNTPFDPAVLVDEGKVYLYIGFAPIFPIPRMQGQEMPGASVVELEQDMLTVKSGPTVILPSKKYAGGTEFEGHAFFEACSIRKIDGRYNLVYSSESAHELCCALSDQPDSGFRYGGVIISNADLGYQDNRLPRNCFANNHGGLECVNGQWYIFYHRHTHGHQCSRQGCAEPVTIASDGSIAQVELTSCGLNGGPLAGKGVYSAGYACCLYGPEGGKKLLYGKRLNGVPYIASEGKEHPIYHFADGCTAIFRYFDLRETSRISVMLRGDAGKLHISDGETELAALEFGAEEQFALCSTPVSGGSERAALTLRYEGKGEIQLASVALS